MYITGIDFSMRAPCLCIGSDISDFKQCSFYYLTDKKSLNRSINDQFHGIKHIEYDNNEQRFDLITDWVIDTLPEKSLIFLEGYAYGAGSHGLIFQIGEVTGLLKHKLYKKGYEFHIVEPTKVKKFWTGKGNSSKQQMKDVFNQKYPDINLETILNSRSENPISDIIDSYAIYLYGLDFLKMR